MKKSKKNFEKFFYEVTNGVCLKILKNKKKFFFFEIFFFFFWEMFERYLKKKEDFCSRNLWEMIGWRF